MLTMTPRRTLQLILIIAFATVVRASQMPAWSAATECARAAIASQAAAERRQRSRTLSSLAASASARASAARSRRCR